MAETEHEHEHEHEGNVSNVHCMHCGGEIEDPNERIRGMIESMTEDFAANPDLASKFFIMLKLASEKAQ